MLGKALRGSVMVGELARMALMLASMSSTDRSGGTNLDKSPASFNSFSARSPRFAWLNILAASA